MGVMSHATVGTNRLEEAIAFYDDLLVGIGLTVFGSHPRGGRMYMKDGKLNFAVLKPADGEAATVGNGTMIAFTFETRAEVDAFHARILALGGTDAGAPAVRGPNWYFAYGRDLDGNKLCGFTVN